MRKLIKESLRMSLFTIIAISLMWNVSLAQPKDWPRNVTIGTGSIGGVAFIHGGGVARIIYEKMGISAVAEVTGGSIANVRLANAKDVTFASSHSASAHDGWNGLDWAKGTKFQNIRALFHQYDTFIQLYSLKKSGVKTIYDLTGKSLGVGPLGGFPHIIFPLVLEGLGIKPSRYINAGISDLDFQLRDGLVDANANITGMPWMVVREIEAVHDINVFGITKKEFQKAEKAFERYPFLGSRIIPKGTYKANRDSDIETLISGSFYYTHKDTPDDFVYEVVKKVNENVDILIATAPAAKGERPESVVEYSPIPLHPGAIKYYQERGIKIPDRLIPPK